MSLYTDVLEASKEVDRVWEGRREINSLQIRYPVPTNHIRHVVFESYPLLVMQLSRFHFLDHDLVLVDAGISSLLKRSNERCHYVNLKATENHLKTREFLAALIAEYQGKSFKRVLGIGGGILLNVAGYIAEQLSLDLILIPTTIVGMSDAAIGGKVRVNSLEHGFTKHAYKSFYEPSQIILDPRFLEALDNQQIRLGLSEIIKHAIYQSDGLLEYMLSDQFEPYSNKESLLKAILWAADLKRVCLEVDPAESSDGSYKILRAAHDISDRLEEASELTMPHSEAVWRAMQLDLKGSPREAALDAIYAKLGTGF